MANTVLGSVSADLAGEFLSVDRLRYASLTLNNASILTLPSGPQQIVAAVTNTFLIPIWALIWSDFSAGAYTNVKSGGTGGTPFISIRTNTNAGLPMRKGLNIATESYTDFTDFFATATAKAWIMGSQSKLSGTLGEGLNSLQTVANLIGNITISVDNSGLGNFTGGNPANTMKIVLGYLKVAK